MSRILRAGRRALARRARPPGTGDTQPRLATGRGPLLATRAGRAGAAVLFTQDLAAAAHMAAGQNGPAAPATGSRRRAPTTHRLLPRTIQLCIHCRQSPAGFWVSHDSSQTARRPWCLSCIQHLDPDRHRIQPSTARTMIRRFTRPLPAAPAAVADLVGLTGSRDAWLACAACTGGHHCGLAAPSELALCACDESVTGKDGTLPPTSPSIPTARAASGTTDA